MSEALGGVNRDPLPDHAADRDTAKCKLIDAELIGDLNGILPQTLDGVFTRRHGGRPVSTHVVAQNAKVRREGSGLSVPDGMVCGQRV